MADFKHITNKTFLTLSIVFIILLLISLHRDIRDIKNLKKNVVYTNQDYDREQSRTIKITQSVKHGAIKGFLTGLIIYGIRGSIAGGIIFGVSSGLTALL